MRLSTFLLVAGVAFGIASDVVSGSPTESSDVTTTAEAVSSGRLLRTNGVDAADRYDDSDDEERAFTGALVENAAGTVAKLTRSKSLPNEKAVVGKLTRSKSAIAPKKLNHNENVKLLQEMEAYWKQAGRQKIVQIEREGVYTPDDIFRELGLKPALAKRTKALKAKMYEVENADYMLWYKYSKYYKKMNPNWVSKIEKP